jgi:hypothetical protein
MNYIDSKYSGYFDSVPSSEHETRSYYGNQKEFRGNDRGSAAIGAW